VKRAALLLCMLTGLALAGALAAVVGAGSAATQATTSSTATTTTTPSGTIATGVTIAGLAVGGMSPTDAATAVQAAFDAPIQLTIAGTRVLVTPDVLGATANIPKAIERASTAAPDTRVPLGIATDGPTLTAFVAGLAKRYDRQPVDTKLFLRRGRPWLSKERAGLRLDQRRGVRDIIAVLSPANRAPVRLVQRKLEPRVTRRTFGPVIVIHRGLNQLFLYRGTRYQRVFHVATGQSAYPTPLGRFTIAVKWRNPWWYPPDSAWAKGAKPIPPGPGNPLGTRWMGLTAPGVGIHGTPDSASIGYSVSHGCIRMRISEAEWLFNHVDIGATVFIVPH
jgi:L,D-transpeptidase catalytic domain/Putative peptidoglycan binding domain